MLPIDLIDPRWLCHALGEALPENAVISEETTVYRSLIQETIPRSKTQSYFARVTGGLGVGFSYALGVKLAMPERPVFALIGDGAFHYNAVPSCLGVAEEIACRFTPWCSTMGATCRWKAVW